MKDAGKMNFANTYTKTQDQSKECIPKQIPEAELNMEIEKIIGKTKDTAEKEVLPAIEETEIRARVKSHTVLQIPALI